MARVGRYTTPTHIFTVPFDPSTITLLSIVYEQADTILMEKHLEDITLRDNSISVTLTEEETALFKAVYPVKIQLRVGIGSSRLNSGIISCSVEDVLKEGELDDS